MDNSIKDIRELIEQKNKGYSEDTIGMNVTYEVVVKKYPDRYIVSLAAVPDLSAKGSTLIESLDNLALKITNKVNEKEDKENG